MSSMIDMVGAAILYGILLLVLSRVQANMNTTMQMNTFNLETQTTAVVLARQIEADLTKAGYRTGSSTQRIAIAEPTRIAFNGALTYGGTVDSVIYFWDTSADATTMNPRDRRFMRYAMSNGRTVSQRLGMTDFYIAYYDAAQHRMGSINPMGSTVPPESLGYIRAVDVRFRVESFENITNTGPDTSGYFKITWEKLLYPRNLGRPF